jgi:hypothetical protein
MVGGLGGSRRRARMLRITSSLAVPASSASATAASTTSIPSISTAASTRTKRRSASSPEPSLRLSRVSAGGSDQSWNGAPLRRAPGFLARTGR